MRATAAALAAVALAITAGCAHVSAPTPLPTAQLAPLPEPDQRLVLIGDAGVETSTASVLDEAAQWVEAGAAMTRVIFLGDNYYPHRIDERVAILGRQRDVRPGHVTFVAGNHDWHPRGFRLFGHSEPERIRALAGAANESWEPSPGELLAVESGEPYRVPALDSERWRLAAVACARASGACTELRAAEQALTVALACADCAPAIVVAHHPLQSVGEHGGCGMSWLRRVLKIGGQDLHAPAYQAYAESLRRALAPNPPLLFAAGHDHSLQFARDPALGAHLVSGAGAKRSPVCEGDGESWSRRGFAAVDFTPGRSPLLRVFAQADDGALLEVLREPLAP